MKVILELYNFERFVAAVAAFNVIAIENKDKSVTVYCSNGLTFEGIASPSIHDIIRAMANPSVKKENEQ